MPEIVNLRTRSPEELFSILAVVIAEKAKNIPRREDSGLEICLTINGVEVPFVETVQALYHRFEREIEERAAKHAYEKLRLKSLFDTIDGFDFQIRTMIEETFKVDLPER